MNATITVVSAKQYLFFEFVLVFRKTWGDAHSHTAPQIPEAAPKGSVKNQVTKDVLELNRIEPGARFRIHSPGINYQGISLCQFSQLVECPIDQANIVIEKGFGRFNLVEEIPHIKCLCHNEPLSNLTVTISANNWYNPFFFLNSSIWGYKGNFTNGQEENDRGQLGNESYDVITLKGQFSTFVIAAQSSFFF